MLIDQASVTMQAVCAARASFAELVALDPLCKLVEQHLPESTTYKNTLDEYSRGWFSKTVLMRTLFFSNILDMAADHYEQVIVSSFGLDFRTLSHPYWRQQPKFLLDHPASLNISKQFLNSAAAKQNNTFLLPADLTQLSSAELNSQLQENGFDPQAKTLLLWEGASYYFDRDSVLNILNIFSNISKQMRISFDYVNNELMGAEHHDMNQSLRYVKQKNEPWKSGFHFAELKDFLNSRQMSNVFLTSDMQLQQKVFHSIDPDYQPLFNFIDASNC